MQTLHDLYTRIQLQQSSEGSPTMTRKNQNFNEDIQLCAMQSSKDLCNEDRKFINIPHLQKSKGRSLINSQEASPTIRSKLGSIDSRIRPIPYKIDLLAGGNSINSQKNSITDQQDSVLTTTNTNFTPSKWIPKPDKDLQQKQQIFYSLLNQYLPKNVKITKGSAGEGRYKTVNQDQLNGRKGSLPSKKDIKQIIGQTQKQRTKYKRNKIRRNVLRDQMFLHRENDYFKDMFLDEYYKRRNIIQKNQYISHLECKVYNNFSTSQAVLNQASIDQTPLYNKIKKAHGIGIQNTDFYSSIQTSKNKNPRSQIEEPMPSFISPSKLAQSFQSVFQANATISYQHPQNKTISTLDSPKSIATEDILRQPQFNRFSHLYKMNSKQAPLSKSDMSTKFNSKLQQMRQRYKNGQIRVGTSPMSHSMYYQRLGMEMSKHLASKDRRAIISTTSTSTRKNKGLGEMINKFNRSSQIASRQNNKAYKSLTSASHSRQSPGINKNNVRGAGKGTEISYTGAEARTKQFYRDILSDTTTPLILPEIGLLMKKNKYQNKRLEKSAGGIDGRKFMSLGNRSDVKRLALTQNYFNKQGRGQDDINQQKLQEQYQQKLTDEVRTAEWSPRDSNVRMF